MIWRDVVGYEGIYEVSNTGQVRTKEGKTTHSVLHGQRTWEQRILKQKVSKDNTCRVSLYKDKKQSTWMIHRLVADAFLVKIEGKDYINHIDGSRLNNHASNLEWCNHTENNNHAFDNDLIQTQNKIVLVHKETKEAIYFRSMARASEYLGRNNGYVSYKVKKGSTDIDGYEIFIKALKEAR